MMTGSGAPGGLVLALSTPPDGPALAARGMSPARGGCEAGAGGHGRMGSMTTVRSGVPGHDDGTAFVRLRRGKLADDPSGPRVCDKNGRGPV